MVDTLEKAGIAENARVLSGLLATFGPPSWAALRNSALERFEEAGIPTSKDEEFKYTNLRVLREVEFGPAYGANIDRQTLPDCARFPAATIGFSNGEHAPDLSAEVQLPAGVVLSTLAEAWDSHRETLDAYLGKVASLEGRLGSTNDTRFVDLNTAHLGEGAFLYVPQGASVEVPIHLLFANRADHGNYACHPRILIVVEPGASAKIVESHVGLDGTYVSNAVAEVVIGRGAVVEHTRVQMESASAVHIGNWFVQQADDSTYTSNNVCLGSAIARMDLNVYLDGEHTETWLNGAVVGLDEQVLDNHTRIDHAKPNCNSFEVYKNILGDRATGVFNGKIFVYEDAQKTDAKQTNQGILLSPTATFDTKPQLEIFADDVKCTHGATVGQLREDALFYLQTRGIPFDQARAMLVYAFAAEVLEKITVEPVREALEKVLYEKLGTGG